MLDKLKNLKQGICSFSHILPKLTPQKESKLFTKIFEATLNERNF